MKQYKRNVKNTPFVKVMYTIWIATAIASVILICSAVAYGEDKPIKQSRDFMLHEFGGLKIFSKDAQIEYLRLKIIDILDEKQEIERELKSLQEQKKHMDELSKKY